MDVNSSNSVLTGIQPASLSGNTYQYETAMSGPIHKGGKYTRSIRRRGTRSSRGRARGRARTRRRKSGRSR